jgi:hypothetical protein
MHVTNFNILQGVRQGGILSADLYKICIDPLLKQLQQSRLGMNIGYIECGATACADDITLNCTDPTEAQIMLNMAYNYSYNEQYKLQPQKSMVIQMESKKKNLEPLFLNIGVNNPVFSRSGMSFSRYCNNDFVYNI